MYSNDVDGAGIIKETQVEIIYLDLGKRSLIQGFDSQTKTFITAMSLRPHHFNKFLVTKKIDFGVPKPLEFN